MLELQNISKDYPIGTETVHALKQVSIAFRHAEFVSVLGPSGCGKTTLLNLIGGLDRATGGELIINGRSTRQYRDRDWDAYRNHSVGFVFQSYNLIPHQTVLQNVELALSLSGVKKAERRKRAERALAAVGLSSQLNKRPSEMSGGQIQRVAIARAIVNDPAIILADEPTGALDSDTGVQVMEILKEIAKDRLVVMVTHNPELADRYSTRIIRMLDGEILSDSAPLTAEELSAEAALDEKKAAADKTRKLPSLSLATSFGLSLRNLITKKGRTILTSFAGSIGIIGIALIYAVSSGMTSFINQVQEETLSSYPLTLESQHTDLSTMLMSFSRASSESSDHENDAVYERAALYRLVNAISQIETHANDLGAFKNYLETALASQEDSALKSAVSGVQYAYNLQLPIYTKNEAGDILLSDTQELLSQMLTRYAMQAASSGSSFGGGYFAMTPSSSSSSNGFSIWQELLPGRDGELINPLLLRQYDLVSGKWPAAYDEIVVVLDENNEIDDMTLYALGLISEEEINRVIDAAATQTEIETPSRKWSYEEILGMTFRTVLNADRYAKDESTGLYTDLRETATGLAYLYDNGIPLKVVGIIRQSPDSTSGMLSGTVCYTSLLTDTVIERNAASRAVADQKADPATDIFTGLPFRDGSGALTQAAKAQTFLDHVSGLSTEDRADLYVKIVSSPSEEQLEEMVKQGLASYRPEDIRAALAASMSAETGMSEADVAAYLATLSDGDLTELFRRLLTEQVKEQYAASVAAGLAAMTTEQLSASLDPLLSALSEKQLADCHDSFLAFSESSYDGNLTLLGAVDPEVPSQIGLYVSTFADKDVLKAEIDAYNRGRDEMGQITYTDYVGLIMSSVTTIINAITYVLIAFVSVSLVVSSIMIGVITLISVQERTKEIGILRSIGASKKNVSGMFNAETMIIGFASGLIGVLVTYLLCLPINLILALLTGLSGLRAFLPIPAAILLIAVSVLLTLISGIIPSRGAAKKDPVVALRTE